MKDRILFALFCGALVLVVSGVVLGFIFGTGAILNHYFGTTTAVAGSLIAAIFIGTVMTVLLDGE